MVKFLLIFLVAVNSPNSWSKGSRKEVTLSQKDVAELVLEQGFKTQEVNYKYQQFRLSPVLTLSAYDWKLTAESGYEYDKSVSLLSTWNPTNYKYDRYKTTMSVQKPFTTGTTLGLELSRLSQKANYDGFTGSPPPSQQTLDIAGLTLEQALLGNFFGVSDRGNVNAAELTFQANNVTRANELEDVVLQAIRQYWTAYVAQENFKEALASRDRYKKLVDSVKKKTAVGYSNPGDLPQVLAELETREQKVKTTSSDYLSSLENLLTILNLEAGTEVQFQVPKEVPLIPELPKKNIESLRDVRAQKLKVEAAGESLAAVRSISYPTLNLVGKVYSTGVNESAEGSFSDLASGTRPKYYMGLKFQYYFGSNAQNETIINRKVTMTLEETKLRRQLLEAQDKEIQAQRRVHTTYALAMSVKKQREFREKVTQELTRSYAQGRTDMSILITALNNFFDSEVQYSRAVGDYAIALNEWAATRDELIPGDESSQVLNK